MAIIGIDFGNINSFPAYVLDMDPVTHKGGTDMMLLPAQNDKLGIPSSFHCKDGNFSYGDAAVHAVPKKHRRNLLKRRMGTSETIDGTEVNYDEVNTNMIKHIVDLANQELQKKGMPTTNQIALAYPVSFTTREKERLGELAEKAVLATGEKLEVAGMIAEPAAAALTYLSTLPDRMDERDYTVLVYDLGGGTFDASIVTAHQMADGTIESYQVLGQMGSKRAGNEFTEKMEELILQGLAKLGGIEPTSDAQRERLHRDAEELKILLSMDDTEFVVYCDNDDNEVEITRTQFEEASEDLINETIKVAQKLYNSVNVKVDMIVMTGGQSQMPVLKQRLQAAFPDIDSKDIILYEPQRAIGFGAARFGALNITQPAQAPQDGNSFNGTGVVRSFTGFMMGLANVVDYDHSKKCYKDNQHVKELIPKGTAIPMTEPAVDTFWPSKPTLHHKIELWEAVVDDPDVYNPQDFCSLATVTMHFRSDKPIAPKFRVAVWIDAANKIHFEAKDAEGNLFDDVYVEVDYSNSVGG